MRTFFSFLMLLLTSTAIMAQTYNVTFKVNMNEVTDPFTTPEVNGTFNGWCGGCAPMSDPDADGIWELTIALEAGTYEYKFAADSWTIQEALSEGSFCTVSAFGFTNRLLVVTGDAVLDPVCWGSCSTCEDLITYDVTFQVNMNDVADPFTTPEVNGNFAGWCGGCYPLSDPDGDGIWSTTISLEPGTYEYKFAYDSWAGSENLTPGDPCTITTDGFTNRIITVGEDVVLDPVCWASCDICLVAELEQMDLPVTFDEAGIDYGLIGFGGAEASSIVTDPTDATNTVAQVIKSATAELWAGTTITNPAGEGFATPIPFTVENTSMSVRVWSPDAGIQVRLKVEDHLDPTHSVETEATTTVAGAWETLIFNFSNEAPGTAALNLDYVFDKASIFFNFGVTGAEAGEKTYYFDDVEFFPGGGTMFYNVTFAVNMNEVAEAFTTPEVNGTFNGWCGGCNPLTDDDGDGIWTTTLELAEGFYEFKYAADGWAIQESLTPGDPCTMTTDIFTNRVLTVDGDVVMDVVCWGSCENCASAMVCDMPTELTVSDITSTGATFNWVGTAAANQYVITIANMATGASGKQRTGSETSFTAVDELAPSTTYAVRVKSICYDLEMRSDASETVYFTTAPLREGSFGASQIFPNPSTGLLQVQSSLEGVVMVSVYAATGQLVHQLMMNGQVEQANLSHLANGLYTAVFDNSVTQERIQFSIIK